MSNLSGMSGSRRLIARAAAGFALVSLTAALAAPSGQASNPTSGSISAESPSTSWTGGPFLALNPTADTDCIVPEAPYCDVYRLEVASLPDGGPDVAVTIDMDNDADIINVAVFDEAGNNVADAGSLGSTQIVVVQDAQPGTYSVRVELMLGVPTTATYRGSAVATDGGQPVDLEQGCLNEETQVVLEPDDGRTVDLDVLVLLDGVDQGFAESFFVDVAKPPARLELNPE